MTDGWTGEAKRRLSFFFFSKLAFYCLFLCVSPLVGLGGGYLRYCLYGLFSFSLSLRTVLVLGRFVSSWFWYVGKELKRTGFN